MAKTDPASVRPDSGLRGWLLCTTASVTLPHLLYQPYWLSALLLLFLFWSAYLWRKQGLLPGRWPIVLLVIAVSLGIWVEYRTLFGREPGVSLLIVFLALKLLEVKQPRDVFVAIGLSCFLLMTYFLSNQSLLSLPAILLSLALITGTLIRLQTGPDFPVNSHVKAAGRLLLQALPLMLVLFVLFPRINGPLWGLPKETRAAHTGLSDDMAPGSISELVQNPAIAFRVKFLAPLPNRQALYWRGPVLENFDGKRWQQAIAVEKPPTVNHLGQPLRYEMTLEVHQQRWLLALDAPYPDANFAINHRLTAETREPIQRRIRITLASSLDYRFNPEESQTVRQRNLQLPVRTNPQTRNLATRWREQYPDPEQRIKAALNFFATEGFVYTLRPPLLGDERIDDFLFRSKRGFCEHYAAAFVVLMRATGIPARVVTGYQGGEINPEDGYWTVRQSDAHAWAEVWLGERGWIRIDPTAIVSPSRLDEGLSQALPDEALPVLLRIDQPWLKNLQYRWEALNNTWNQHVLGYNQLRQQHFLEKLGLDAFNWQQLASWFAISVSVIIGFLSYGLLRKPAETDPSRELWLKALRYLARKGVNCPPAMTPLQLLDGLTTHRPELLPYFQEITVHYLACRYANCPNALHHLAAAIRRLP